MIVYMPKSLDLRGALGLCKKLELIEKADSYEFDFRSTGHVEPCGMLVVASEISKFMDRRFMSNVTFQNYKHMTYAAHMGFFRSFGLDFGKAPGQAMGSKSYIPLTILYTDDLVNTALEQGTEVGDQVELEGRKLAATLVGDEQDDVFETLAYSVREIMRNVVEHAEAEQIGMCAQFWKRKSLAEVAIIDRGRGIRKSLSANPHIDSNTDKSSINYALMPAVSGVAYKGGRQRNRRSPWANSGFGLYMTNRLCRNGGNFFICSGDTGMLLTSTSGKRYFKTSFEGTIVRMQLRTENLKSLRNSLERYRVEGYEIQKKYSEIVSIDPSSASLMLSEDFDLGLWDKILNRLKSGK